MFFCFYKIFFLSLRRVIKIKMIANKVVTSNKEPIYIDPLTDFGFKRLFGDKELMLNFLNSILKIEGGITDLSYKNTVRVGESKEDKSVIFDLYCETATGEHIIVEMQVISHKNFKERVIYYVSRAIQEQGWKGKNKDKKEWGYDLKAVYSINIVNFRLDNEIDNKNYISYIKLRDEKNRVFSDKLTLVYIELPRFTKNKRNIKTDIEQWVYALKYLPTLYSLPKALQNEIFEKLFEQAKISQMTQKERNIYLKSLYDMGIYRNEITRMSNQITSLSNQNTSLSNQNTSLSNQITTLSNQNTTLSNQNTTLSSQITSLSNQNTAQANQITAQAKVIANLKKRLGLSDADTAPSE